jgi:hypothetical protein
LQQRWITVDELAGRVREFAGRHGAKRLARFARLAGSGARSSAERRAIDLLRRAGITGWVANAEIYDESGQLIAIGDLVFPAERLVIKVDGRPHHVTPDRFERDRYRQNRLVEAGWTVLRFTWRDLTQRPGYVIATLRRLLEMPVRGNDDGGGVRPA